MTLSSVKVKSRFKEAWKALLGKQRFMATLCHLTVRSMTSCTEFTYWQNAWNDVWCSNICGKVCYVKHGMSQRYTKDSVLWLAQMTLCIIIRLFLDQMSIYKSDKHLVNTLFSMTLGLFSHTCPVLRRSCARRRLDLLLNVNDADGFSTATLVPSRVIVCTRATNHWSYWSWS